MLKQKIMFLLELKILSLNIDDAVRAALLVLPAATQVDGLSPAKVRMREKWACRQPRKYL